MAWAHLCDVRCYYETLGRGDALLMIPGLGMTCRSFDPVRDELAERFSVVAVDNRGVGQSVALRPAKHMSALAADLLDLLDHLQIERAHVLGLSLGGIIAQRFAVDHPGRVNRLVLISCTDRFTPYLRQITGLLAKVLRRFPREAFQRVIELLGTSPQYLDAHLEEMEVRVKDKTRMLAGRLAMAQQLQCVACSEIEADQYRITAPTLVVAGEHDVLIPYQYARRMADKIPGSRFVLLPGIGHNPFEEDPGRIVPEIMRFLSEGAERTRRAAPWPWAARRLRPAAP